MKQNLHFITLGVNDFEGMKKFYKEVFGWTPMTDNEGITFFKVNGMILSLYDKKELAEDIGIEENGEGFKRITFAILFNSEEEVNAAFEELQAKGARAAKLPVKAFWGGYSGYIADPEDNYWELAHNPFIEMNADGLIMANKG